MVKVGECQPAGETLNKILDMHKYCNANLFKKVVERTTDYAQQDVTGIHFFISHVNVSFSELGRKLKYASKFSYGNSSSSRRQLTRGNKVEQFASLLFLFHVSSVLKEIHITSFK